MLGIKTKVKEFDTNAVAEKALDLFSGAKEQLKKGITDINDARNARYSERDELLEKVKVVDSQIENDSNHLEVLTTKLANLDKLI